MDPNATLELLRKQAQEILDNYEKYTGHDPIADDAANLAELVQSLDQWLTNGGFLPEEWKEQDLQEEDYRYWRDRS